MSLQSNTPQDSGDIIPWSPDLLPVIPTEEYQEHTLDRPFCTSENCPCREDQDAINELYGHYQDGLASQNDLDNIYHGRTV